MSDLVKDLRSLDYLGDLVNPDGQKAADYIEELEAALQSIARWATDEKLSAWERVSIIAHHPSIRAALPHP